MKKLVIFSIVTTILTLTHNMHGMMLATKTPALKKIPTIKQFPQHIQNVFVLPKINIFNASPEIFARQSSGLARGLFTRNTGLMKFSLPQNCVDALEKQNQMAVLHGIWGQPINMELLRSWEKEIKQSLEE